MRSGVGLSAVVECEKVLHSGTRAVELVKGNEIRWGEADAPAGSAP